MRLSEKEESALGWFRRKLQETFPGRLVQMKMYGSRARGNARKDSDIDVLVVVSTGDWHVADVVYGIATEVFLETGVCVSPKVINRKQYRRLSRIGAPFLKNVVREGVAV